MRSPETSLPDTIAAARALLESGEMRCADLVERCLARIEKSDPTLCAFLSTFAQLMRESAREFDAKCNRNALGAGVYCTAATQGATISHLDAPLAGIPIAIKDNLCTSVGTTTCGSRMLENFHAPYDATVVRKLQAAGALIIGKTNLDEFAMGSSCENSYFGPTRNPWDPSRVPGGSSGGSAAALAAGMCLGSIGSDTGGSIRLPASFCGLVGLKPTYGRVSRYGLVAFASSLDQVGPFAWTVEDAAILLNVIAGPDPMDSTCLPNEVPDYTANLNTPIDGLRIGIVKQFREAAGIDPQVAKAFEESLNVYRQHGATIVDVDLPNVQYGIAAYYIIAPCEASSNLARYDGVHFGHRTSDPVKDIAELFSKSRAEGFGPEVQRRILIGTYALSSGYYDAYYNNALKVRRLIKNDFDAAFQLCDVIATPTGPTPAFRLGEKTADPMSMYLTDVFTVTCNIAGLPGLSLPCGFTTDAKPLPIGLQLLGPLFSEEKLLRAARMYESKTDWHTRRPTM